MVCMAPGEGVCQLTKHMLGILLQEPMLNGQNLVEIPSLDIFCHKINVHLILKYIKQINDVWVLY